MNRNYTVEEIDALRRVVENKYLFGQYEFHHSPQGGSSSRSYKEDEMVRVVEERIRTHMLAGHTAADLLASEAI